MDAAYAGAQCVGDAVLHLVAGGRLLAYLARLTAVVLERGERVVGRPVVAGDLRAAFQRKVSPDRFGVCGLTRV